MERPENGKSCCCSIVDQNLVGTKYTEYHGKPGNIPVTQNVFGAADMVQDLMALSMLSLVSNDLRTLALYAVSDLIRNHDANKDLFLKATVQQVTALEISGIPNQKPPPATSTPSLVAIIKTTLSKEAFNIRAASCLVFQVSSFYQGICRKFANAKLASCYHQWYQSLTQMMICVDC
jgi:hypothetical protein